MDGCGDGCGDLDYFPTHSHHNSFPLLAHEVAGMIDGSMATKMTVQFNLFGGTVINLGGERFRKYLDGIDSMDNMGCFALTELGYGNNAVEMETVKKRTL